MAPPYSLSTHQDPIPSLWQAAFPPDIMYNLVSYANPTGTVTNLDLELAGTFIEQEDYVLLLDNNSNSMITLLAI
jgi:hypothetical protein